MSKEKEKGEKNTQDKRKEKLERKETHACEMCEGKSNVHKGKRGKGDTKVIQVTSVIPKTVLEWKRAVLEGRSLAARSPVCRAVPILTTANMSLRIASRVKW
jgi:hypothetical protein